MKVLYCCFLALLLTCLPVASHSRSEARRIISLSPNISEILDEIGAGHLIVGRDSCSDFPSYLQKIPVVGNYYHCQLEAIIKLKPNLIVLETGGGLGHDLNNFRKLHIPILIVKLDNLAAISKTMRLLGLFSGHEQGANRVAEDFDSKVNQLSRVRKNKVKIFYQLWPEPLMSVNNKTIIGEVIERCGGENIVGHTFQKVPIVSREYVLCKKPDLYIGSTKGFEQKWLVDKYPSKTLSKFIYIEPEQLQRVGPRLLIGMQKICQEIDRMKEKS